MYCPHLCCEPADCGQVRIPARGAFMFSAGLFSGPGFWPGLAWGRPSAWTPVLSRQSAVGHLVPLRGLAGSYLRPSGKQRFRPVHRSVRIWRWGQQSTNRAQVAAGMLAPLLRPCWAVSQDLGSQTRTFCMSGLLWVTCPEALTHDSWVS